MYRFISVLLFLVVFNPDLYASSIPESVKAYLPKVSLPDPTSFFKVKIKSSQPKFHTYEPITFEVLSGDNIFVYLFSYDPDTDKAELLFPNDKDTAHYFTRELRHQFPNKQVEIFADTQGVERIYALATREEQPWHNFEQVKIEKYESTGSRGFRLRLKQEYDGEYYLLDTLSVLIYDEDTKL